MKARDFDIAKKVVEEWCRKKDDPSYKDFQFFLDGMSDRTYPAGDFLCEDLLLMIEAKEEGKTYPEIVSFQKPEAKNEKASFEEMNQILKVENGPLGKATAKPLPDLFAEMDLHFALKKGEDKALEKYGRILEIPLKSGQEAKSIDAMLGDLMADNLVMRAKYLSKYEDPDWAFEQRKFLNGDKEEKAYSALALSWNEFKDDQINDHSLAFVCLDEKDREKAKQFGAIELGKSEDEKLFYDKVLAPLEKECFTSKEKIVERKGQYAKAREEFLKQLEVTLNLQKELGSFQFQMLRVLSDVETWEKSMADAKSAVEHNEARINDAQEVVNGFQKDRKELDDDMEALSDTINQETAKIKELEKQINECKQKTTVGFAKAEETLKSVGVMTKLLSKKKYEEAVELSDRYHKEACDAQDLDLKLSKEAKDLGMKLRELLDAQTQMEDKRAFFTEEIGKRNREINECRQAVEKNNEKIAETQELLKKADLEREKLLEGVKKEGESGKRIILDRAYFSDLFSEDQGKADQRRRDIPWTTARYDEEREKLRKSAEKLCTEFARSSHRLRENLITLEQYWGVKMGDDGKKVEFHPMDRTNMIPALYRSLFLYLPAISLKADEVAELFEDGRKPGLFGKCVLGIGGEVKEIETGKVAGTIYRARGIMVILSQAEPEESIGKKGGEKDTGVQADEKKSEKK